MCWGIDFWIGTSPGNEKIEGIEIDNIAGLQALYRRYGKDVPEEIFDTDFFEEGKRVPYSKMPTNLCLCSANPRIIINFVARAIMKETRGIDVDVPLNKKQQSIHDHVTWKINDTLDHLRDTTFRGNGLHVSISWL